MGRISKGDAPVDHAVLVVHHLQDDDLVVGVDRGDRDVPHGTELTTVVEMFVLQAEKVPHEAAEHLERGEHRGHQVAGHDPVLGEREGQGPHEPQHQVLDDGEVVEELNRMTIYLINLFIMQKTGII